MKCRSDPITTKRSGDAEQDREYIRVQFGFRALSDGKLALAAYLPDLVDKSEAHVERWRGFLVRDPEWTEYEQDDRFRLWVRRYLEGDWHVDDGPASNLRDEIRLINGLTGEAVGAPLFELGDEPHIDYPSAQNSHRYEDAHKELYRSIHDAISKPCIERLGSRRGQLLKLGSDRTLVALKKLLPSLNGDAAFETPLDNISEQRRRASHKHRPAAVPCRAFEAFTEDLRACVGALSILRRTLEQEFGMDAERSTKRQDALRRLPEIATPPQSNYSINRASAMAGKTVERVEVGSRRQIPRVHESELIIVHFTDGSIMSLETGSNAQNVLPDGNPQDFHVSFHVHWVPPK